VKELLFAGGFGSQMASWSPVVQALAVVAVATVLLVVLLARSDKPTKRLVAVIKAIKGR
jgi:hypothetical protein